MTDIHELIIEQLKTLNCEVQVEAVHDLWAKTVALEPGLPVSETKKKDTEQMEAEVSEPLPTMKTGKRKGIRELPQDLKMRRDEHRQTMVADSPYRERWWI